MRGLVLGVLVCALLLVATGSAWADGIDPAFSWANASAGSRLNPDASNSQSVSVGGASAPWDRSASAAFGDDSAESDLVYSSGSVTLSGTFTTDGEQDSRGFVWAYIRFTADGACDYTISGGYAFDGGVGQGRFSGYLRDVTTNTYLFDNWQLSTDVDGEAFTLGESGGTDGNSLTGSLTGSLVDGHEYLFYSAAYIVNVDNTDPLSGSAWATFAFTSNPVPEPTTLALFGLGAGALALRRRKRRLA